MSFYINNGMRKKDLNFTGIGPKKMCFNYDFTGICTENFFEA